MRPRRGTAAAAIGLAALAIAALRGRLRRYEIAESSMEPALHEGDWVVARLGRRTPRRSSIVVFPSPIDPDMELVKRVVGLPGELVTISNGQVHIGDRVLAEAWADGPTLPDGEWQLGPGELFVLGDARSRSKADSRTFGPIQAADAAWRITARYRPIRAIGRV